MSLNGLDVPAVQEAYSNVVNEAGGWCVSDIQTLRMAY